MEQLDENVSLPFGFCLAHFITGSLFVLKSDINRLPARGVVAWDHITPHNARLTRNGSGTLLPSVVVTDALKHFTMVKMTLLVLEKVLGHPATGRSPEVLNGYNQMTRCR